MEDIQTKATAVGPCHYSLEITIPANEVDSAYKAVVKQLGQSAPMPGFRPGKSPTHLIRKRFAAKIKEQVTEDLMKQSLGPSLEQEKLQPITMPELGKDHPQAEEGKDYTFAIEFDVAPEVPLPEYKGMALKRPVADITDEMVNEFLDSIRGNHASFQPVDRPAEAGDLLMLSYQAQLPEGEEVPADAQRMIASQKTYLVLAEPEILPGVIEHLVGAVADETRQAEVTFPDDYRHDYLAGKTFSYSFEVHEVQTHAMPELTDDLAKTMGADTVDELRDMIKKHLGSEKERMQKQALDSMVYSKLLESEDFDLPPRVLAEETRVTLNQVVHEARKKGESDEDLMGRLEEVRQDVDKRARERVKLRYITQAIADAEEIKVDDAEVDYYVSQFKAQSRMTDAQFERQYDEDMVARQGRGAMLTSRVIDVIIKYANIVDVTPDSQQQEAEAGDSAEPDAATTASTEETQ